MAVLHGGPAATPVSHDVRWTWLCVAVTPVGVALVFLVEREVHGAGLTAWWTSALLSLLVLAPPSVGVWFATRAEALHEPHELAALVAAAVALLAALVVLPVVVDAAVGWLLAVGVVVTALGLTLPGGRRTT